jgi:putative DNA primase/helicase
MGAAFDPDATCPSFDVFLELILPDPSMRSFAMKCFSLALFGRNDAQVALLLRGSGGNGKFTLVNIIAHVLGGYSVPCRIEMFLATQVQSASGPTPELAVLPGARMYRASEPPEGAVLSTQRIKELTGGEPQQARKLQGDPFWFTPMGLPVLSFNKTPRIKGDDEGTWRRLIFIPFDVALGDLPENQKREQSQVEAELKLEASGILNRLLEGYRRYKAEGLAPPPRAIEMKAERRAASDPVGEFVEDCTERATGGKIQAQEL